MIGVILTGTLDDGTIGMGAIKSCGGVTIIQHPEDAQYPSMPQSVRDHVPVDFAVRLHEIPGVLAQLIDQEIPAAVDIPARIRAESRMLIAHSPGYQGIEDQGEPSSVSCPECGGPLWRLGGSGLDHYRCHTGHSYTPETLAIRMDDATEQALWTALRLLEERVRVLQRMAGEAREKGRYSMADQFKERAVDAQRNANQIESVLAKL